jgi:hypothetical protein
MNRYANAGPSAEQRALDAAAEQAEAPYIYRTPFQRLRAIREDLQTLGFDSDDNSTQVSGSDVVDFINQHWSELMDLETTLLNIERESLPAIDQGIAVAETLYAHAAPTLRNTHPDDCAAKGRAIEAARRALDYITK